MRPMMSVSCIKYSYSSYFIYTCLFLDCTKSQINTVYADIRYGIKKIKT